MKFIIAYYLLLIYSTLLLQPVIPIAMDWWSHTFAEAEHVMTVHVKYGSDHLEKELANENSDNNNNKDQNSVKLEETTPVHIIVAEYKYEYFLPEPNYTFSTFTIRKIPFIFIAKHIPPPKNNYFI